MLRLSVINRSFNNDLNVRDSQGLVTEPTFIVYSIIFVRHLHSCCRTGRMRRCFRFSRL